MHNIVKFHALAEPMEISYRVELPLWQYLDKSITVSLQRTLPFRLKLASPQLDIFADQPWFYKLSLH